MLKVLNYLTKAMGINTIVVWYYTTWAQLLSQRQTVTNNIYVVTENIGNAIGIRVSQQLTTRSNPKPNE